MNKLIYRPAWIFLAWSDIVLRYRRSTFGPGWITLNSAIFVVGVGFLYAGLFRQPAVNFVHHVAVGVVFWQFFSSSIVESSDSLISSRDVLLNTQFPVLDCTLRVVARNFIILLHNSIIIVFTFLFSGNVFTYSLLFLPFILLIYLCNVAWISVFASIISVRYRDMPLILAAVMQILFILSPIIWSTDQLPDRSAFVTLNPISYLIESVRSPLISGSVDVNSILVSTGLAVGGTLLTAGVYRRYEQRIRYWL